MAENHYGAPVDESWVEDASLPTLKNRFYKEELFGEEPVEGYEKWVRDASGSTIEREYYKRGVLGTLIGGIDGRVSDLIDSLTSSTRAAIDRWLTTKDVTSSEFVRKKVGVSPSGSIQYKTYNTITYSVITLFQHGDPNPGILKSYWDEVQRTPDFRAKEHDIEIARDMSGGTVITNLSGLVHISGMPHGEGQTVKVRGAVVIDGEAIQDFPTDTHWTGWEALAMLKTGELRGYSGKRGETVNDIVNDGAVWASSFGPIIVENGAARDLSDPFWADATSIISSLNIYGQKANGDIVLITAPGKSSVSGGTLADSAAIAIQEGCVFAISMDRGGSAQSFVDAAPVVVSSDQDIAVLIDYNKRLVANYAYSTVPIVGNVKSDAPTCYYSPTLYKPDVGREPRISVDRTGRATLYGNMRLTPAEEGGTLTAWPTTTPSGIIRIPPYARPSAIGPDITGRFYGAGNTSGRYQLSRSDGVLRISYCDASLLYATLDNISWKVERGVQ